jgi:nucleotide-binding universal stress UspA family protein
LKKRKVLLGYDGSKMSEKALDRSIEVVKDSDGELTIVVAADTPGYAAYADWSSYGSFRRDVLEHIKKLSSTASERARGAGVPAGHVEVVATEGYPADVILKTASDRGADLIVIGRTGVRSIEGSLMGSVSSSVINHSNCDVLVVTVDE